MILHQSTMKELAPLLAAALVLCVAAACADRRRQLFWGRSLGVKLLPLFVVLGMARGFGEEHIVLAEQKAALEEADGATIATPSRDTVKLADEEGYAEATTDRSRTWLIQTPQAFYREELLALHRALGDGPERGQITDDCMLLERAGRRVKLVPGRRENIKITTPADRELAEFYLKKGTE